MLELDGSSLDLESLRHAAEGSEVVTLSSAARERMSAARVVVEDALSQGRPVYGLTTGLAERKSVALSPGERRAFNRLVIKGHLIGQGPCAPPEVVRAAMAITANSFAKGIAGVRPELAETVLRALNEGTVPPVRILGSVGESDLGPMADLAEGILAATGFELAENEGLALLNCNSFSTAWAALAGLAAERLVAEADVAASLSLEGFLANTSPLHPVVARARPYEGVVAALGRLRRLLEGSPLFDEGRARNLQDPLSFRGLPQIHGTALDALSFLRSTLETELNSAQGNPAVVTEERRIISVANFEALPVAAALDFSRIALAPLITSGAERTVKLLQKPFSGLPAGLAEQPDSGEDALAELAVTVQGIAAEARTLAQPVSYEVVSTSKADGIEDRTTMAPLSARRLSEMVELADRVVALELVVAAQAIDLRKEPLGSRTGAAHRLLRRLVPFTAKGDTLPPDLEPVVSAVRLGAFSREAQGDSVGDGS